MLQGGERCTRKFNGNSTYQCELQHGGPTAHQQLGSTVGLRSTISCYDGARRYCCCNTAPPKLKQSGNQVEIYLHAWPLRLFWCQAAFGFFRLLTVFLLRVMLLSTGGLYIVCLDDPLADHQQTCCPSTLLGNSTVTGDCVPGMGTTLVKLLLGQMMENLPRSRQHSYTAYMWCRGASSGSIKSLPASMRQPLGFRTMYSSMYGEQIELTQAYGGALSAVGPRPATASCNSSAVRATEPLHSQVGKSAKCMYMAPAQT